MRREIVVLTEHTCLEVEQIERYLLQHLNELEIAVLEERLLVCGRCRETFSLVETYVGEVRRAMSAVRDQTGGLFVRQLGPSGIPIRVT